MQVERERFRFFFDHSGYIVGQRALGAMRAARTEQRFDPETMRYVWDYDEDGDLGNHDYWCGKRSCDHMIEWCRLEVKCPTCKGWETVESLGGIIDADADYRRVIECELLSQHLD